ncbi:hypothetical protein GCM10009617_00760 [Leifsonia poae]|uniref:Prepilin type IV endopeptidase peptidase domain-containing protein n=1 Tax=Leifsonia poae TaxID=110933 RepID=A0A9W6LXT3_9MICO|nr:hypothetical protein GCM10017584_00760 [Leifsonia poae]
MLGLLTITRIGADPLAIAGAGYLAAATGPLWVADRREQRLPNAWVLPGYLFVGVGLAWAALGMGRSPGEAVVTAGVTVTVFLALAAGGGVGLGDVKLAGVLALVLGGLHGAPAAATSFVVAFVAAGAVAVAAMAAGRDGWAGRIAFGPYLLCGFWVVLLLW